MGVVEFKDYSWTYAGYKKPTLKNINLEVKKGEFIGLIGRVGSGRTSLCSSLLGLIPHFYPGNTSGKLIVDGLNVSESSIAELSQHVGLVFQSPINQLSGAGTTVEEELAFGLENLGVPRSEMIKRIDAMIKLIGLESFNKRSPFELSGGQQQRVAIASVMIMEPNVLVLDEPTAQLDPLGTEQVFSFIKKLTRKGITIIMASNKINYLAEFADKVALLDNKIIAFDDARKVLTNIELLRKHKLTPSDLTILSYKLKSRGLWKGPLALNMADAKKMIKQVTRK
ncbi:MAG: ABC transporter ATP-binding protein [Candidatus Nanoarchaeia archaeon]|jgi:energy-coupling factor transport system ATP-binding protein